ncbi:MAG: LiaF domain-containing protein [Gemmatimonadaceae bacterium]
MSEKNRDLSDWWNRPAAAGSSIDRPTVSEASQPPARGIVSIFANNQKEGRWLVPAHLRVFSVFGSAKVDLREAILQHRESTIEVMSIFADVQIIVPPGVAVECDGDALLGAFTVSESKRRDRTPAPPSLGGPVVRVIGSAYVASVTVKIRPPK